MEDKNIRNEFGNFAEKPQVPKKLYGFKYIALGLIIFVGLVFSPIMPNLGKIIPAPAPKLETPVIQKLAEKDRQCVMPREWIRANHMQMLIEWREGVVRSKEGGATNGRDFVAPDGRKFAASLTNTCMDCHSNKADFCDQCHNYVAVAPNCWGCHLEQGKKLAEAK